MANYFNGPCATQNGVRVYFPNRPAPIIGVNTADRKRTGLMPCPVIQVEAVVTKSRQEVLVENLPSFMTLPSEVTKPLLFLSLHQSRVNLDRYYYCLVLRDSNNPFATHLSLENFLAVGVSPSPYATQALLLKDYADGSKQSSRESVPCRLKTPLNKDSQETARSFRRVTQLLKQDKITDRATALEFTAISIEVTPAGLVKEINLTTMVKRSNSYSAHQGIYWPHDFSYAKPE